MYKYLFLTYGELGWRGVQMRAIRIAQYLPKDEVIFWESDDPDFIQSFGFTVEKKKTEFIDPATIIFPKGVEIVIFADLPSNHLFNYGVYIAALKQQKKVVICEQLYRRGQMQEGVFQQFSLQSDLFLLNGLSSFKEEEAGVVKLVPPQIEFSLQPRIKEEIRKKYGIPSEAFLLFGAGYHPDVLAKIEKLSEHLASKGYDFRILISASIKQKKVQVRGNVTYLPFQSGDEYFKLLYAADATLVKFGFLQILESLALHKPTIVLGEGGYVLRTPEILDPALQDVLRFEERITDDTVDYIERLISDTAFRRKITSSLKKLHDGKLFGGKEAARQIQKLKTRKVHHTFAKKKIAILINDEILEKDVWLQKNKIYPLCFVLPFPSKASLKPRLPSWASEIPLDTLNQAQDEILPHSFKHIYLFSKRKFDGLIDILPWYEEWISQIQHMLEAADAIYVSPSGRTLFRSFFEKEGIGEKVRVI